MRVGVLGGGQLGRMLALAGYPLGLRFRFLDPSPDAPAGHVGTLVAGSFSDPDTLRRFRSDVDVVTYELEHVPYSVVEALNRETPVLPGPRAIHVAQDRLLEKQFFQSVGIPTGWFAPVAAPQALAAAAEEAGYPCLLKTRRQGYDGKGQRWLRSSADLSAAWESLQGAPAILERRITFDRELSQLAVRNASGEVRFYPLVENAHTEGILRVSRAPAPHTGPALQQQAEALVQRLLEGLEYVGVLALELFQVGDTLLANEMAPRVHNSGHWTIEGASTSQFENHVRAITGLPLGPTCSLSASTMVNLIGALPPIAELLSVPEARVHLYGKRPVPGRKVGHVTICGESHAAVAARVGQIQALLEAAQAGAG